ncbi:MAG: efflux RND transporter periplasmic adaptor subunit [Candidatus Omnitrophica bacterium]|nr:efflux RND transporter periplasmic adaptor subunit [Candidatus Omnitrophota bacterium]
MTNSKRKTRRRLVVFSVIGLVILGLGIYAYFRKPDPVITVQTEKVTRRNLTEMVVANGKIQPVDQVKISPEVSGEIIELAVKEGQKVRKGDLLMKIKPDTYVASSNIASASYKASLAQNSLARANLDRAEAELKRHEELYRDKLDSESQYLDVKTSYEVAKATYESSMHQADNARAALARAEEDLVKTTIRSPLNGTISQLNSQLGERVVGTGIYQGTEVMTIADLTDMEARVDIGEIDIVLIKIGEKAHLEVDAFRDKKFTGVVSEIANTAKTTAAGSQQEATKFEVRIRINEKEAFRPGMSVTAEVETRSRTNVLAVPIQSVTTRMPKEPDSKKGGTNRTSNAVAKASKANPGQTNKASDTNPPAAKKPNEPPKPVEVVFLVEDGKAKMTNVKRGISDDSYTEILEGITDGREVVSGGYKAINRELNDGIKVKVDNTKMAAGKPEESEN